MVEEFASKDNSIESDDNDLALFFRALLLVAADAGEGAGDFLDFDLGGVDGVVVGAISDDTFADACFLFSS